MALNRAFYEQLADPFARSRLDSPARLCPPAGLAAHPL
jgi:hypothetical protein